MPLVQALAWEQGDRSTGCRHVCIVHYEPSVKSFRLGFKTHLDLDSLQEVLLTEKYKEGETILKT